MLMPGKASVNQRSAREAPAPCNGVPQVAPGIEAQLLLDGPVGIGDGGDAAQVVLVEIEETLQDLVCVGQVVGAFRHMHGKHARGRAEVGERPFTVRVVGVFAAAHVGLQDGNVGEEALTSEVHAQVLD